MKRTLLITFAATAILMAGTGYRALAESAVNDAPVVVELFTSQGCSSCPPADAYLSDLANRDDVIALGFHIDYWDYIGWADPYADPANTERQRDYASKLGARYVYTPQMVIDGAAHEVGSKRPAIEAMIERAKTVRHDRPVIDLAEDASDSKSVKLTIAGPELDEAYNIILVTFDASQLTEVKRGENRGKTLENRNVVRSMIKIGEWKGGELTEIVDLSGMPGDGGCAVLIQQPGGGPILAAAKMDF